MSYPPATPFWVKITLILVVVFVLVFCGYTLGLRAE